MSVELPPLVGLKEAKDDLDRRHPEWETQRPPDYINRVKEHRDRMSGRTPAVSRAEQAYYEARAAYERAASVAEIRHASMLEAEAEFQRAIARGNPVYVVRVYADDTGSIVYTATDWAQVDAFARQNSWARHHLTATELYPQVNEVGGKHHFIFSDEEWTTTPSV